MKLPRHIARIGPPRSSGIARASDIGSIVQTGAGAKWRGVEMVGGTLGQIADMGYQAWQKRHDIDTDIQVAKSTSAMDMAYTGIIGELKDMPVKSPAEREEFRTKYLSRLQDLYENISKDLDNSDAADAFSKSWETTKSQYDTEIYQMLTGSLDQQQKYDKMTQWSGMLSNATAEDVDTVKLFIKKDVEKHIPLFGATWVTNYISNLDKTTTEAREDFYNDRIYDGKSSLEALADQIRQDDSVDKKMLLNNIDEERKRRESKALVEREAYINETHKLAMDALSQDVNDLSIIEKLPDNLKLYWRDKVTNRNKMIEAGKGDPFVNVYDPARYNSFRTIMEQDPTDLKELQIVDAVGRGLTIDQGIDLIDRHRKLSRKDSPLTASEARRGVSRINNAFKAGIIRHPEYIEDAVPGSEEEYQNSILRDKIIDEFEAWLQDKPRTPDEIRIRTNQVLAPYEEMAGESFISRILGNFSYQAMAFSNKEYRQAIDSLGPEAKAEWAHTDKYSGKGFWKVKILPDDFIRKWQSPHKVLTPQIARIYLKWAHGNKERAKTMATKDGWREP